MINENIGIIAGDGDLPKVLIEKINNPFVVGIEGFFETAGVEADHINESLENFGNILEYFRNNNVTKVVMAGGVGKLDVNNFTPQDEETEQLVHMIMSDMGGDDKILRTTIEFINSKGFEVIGIENVLGKQVLPVGILTTSQPDEHNLNDIELGKNILKHLSIYDIGQSIAVQNNTVVAIEAIEGTDAMIKRAGTFKKSFGKPVLIKGKKDDQTNLADLPVIGVTTVENIAENGFCGISVFSEGTIILNKDEVIEKANSLNIFITVI